MNDWTHDLLASLKFSSEHRQLFYRLLGKQLQASVPLKMALGSIASAGLPAPISTAAMTTWESVSSGGTLAQGMAATGSFPRSDIGYLAAAEEHNALAPVLEQLVVTGDEEETLLSIVTANIYMLFIASVLVTMLFNGERLIGPFADFNPAAREMVVAKASALVNSYAVMFFVALATLCLIVVWARWNVTGPSRKFLSFLATEYERRVAIRFCDIAKLLLPTGLEHSELLAIAERQATTAYARRSIGVARKDMNAGHDLPSALAGTLFDKTSVAILGQLVPSGNPEGFSDAFDTLGSLLGTLQKDFYRGAKRTLMIVLMVVNASGILLMITGILELSSLFRTTVF